jgi:hypothetical protein
MAQSKTRTEATVRFEAFLCAGIADLCRFVNLPDLYEICPAIRPTRRTCRVAAIPTSPAVAQLSLYLLLVSRGLQPKHTNVYPHRDRLRNLLERVYRKAIKASDDGDLEDAEGLQPGVRTLAKFARRNIAGFDHAGAGLDAFGVRSVRKSLAILTEKLAMTFAREIAKNPDKAAPVELLGASLVASATSPGVIQRIGNGHTVRGVMRFGVRAGLTGASRSTTGKKTSGVDELRKFLKRADKVLDR